MSCESCQQQKKNLQNTVFHTLNNDAFVERIKSDILKSWGSDRSLLKDEIGQLERLSVNYTAKLAKLGIRREDEDEVVVPNMDEILKDQNKRSEMDGQKTDKAFIDSFK